MKIRNGFVSNSSSSSFLVNVLEPKGNGLEKVLNQQQIDELLARGYRFTDCTHFSQLGEIDHEGKVKGKCLFYDVLCNEEEEMAFLIQNKIPFKAWAHYGHETYFYTDPRNEYIVRAFNFGNYLETYGPEVADDVKNQKSIECIPINNFL